MVGPNNKGIKIRGFVKPFQFFGRGNGRCEPYMFVNEWGNILIKKTIGFSAVSIMVPLTENSVYYQVINSFCPFVY